MANQFLDLAGLSHYDGKLKQVVAGEINLEGRTITLKSVSGAVLGTITIPQTVYELANASQNGLMSSAHFTKLEGIAEGATKVEESSTNGKLKINGQEVDVYVHPTSAALEAGLYKITVDETGHVKIGTAVKKSDITDLGIPAQDTTYQPATESVDGLMAAADKKKLDGISDDANKTEASLINGQIKVDGQEVKVYTHETFTAKESGLYKITVNTEGHVSAATPVVKTDITGLGIPAQDTTYAKASADLDGLMSKEHYTKLEGVAAGAQVNVIEKVSVDGSALPINSRGVNIDLSAYAKKTDITNVYKFKGSVDSFDALPKEGQTTGDVYDVKAAHGDNPAGTNYAWDGKQWDALGGTFAISAISTSEIDKLFAA